MGIERTRALVLNHSNYSNTSLIIRALTPKQGVMSFMAKGFRKPPKRSFSPREPVERFSEMEFTYYESSSDLQHLNEAYVIEPFRGIRKGYDRLIFASFGAGIALDFTGTQGDGEYPILHEFWNKISRGSDLCNSLLSFWLKQLEACGFLPSFENCSNCGESFPGNSILTDGYSGFYCENCAHNMELAIFKGDVKVTQHLQNSDTNKGKLVIPKASKVRILNLLARITSAQVGRSPRLLDQIHKICENT